MPQTTVPRRATLTAAVVAIALLTASCRAATGGGTVAPIVSPTGTSDTQVQIPGWCGGVPMGPAVLPPYSPRPAYTPDPRTLLCMVVENRSRVDMAMAGDGSWGLITACSSMESSGPVPKAPWSYQIGRATPGSIDGPVLGTIDSSVLTGEPPFLIEAVINPDLSVTVRQRTSLGYPTNSYC